MTNNDKKQSFLARTRAFIKFRIIHLDDSPHRIALGASLGMFTAFLPFLGLHTVIALMLAFITRSNKAVALLCSWISNPFTFIPIFVPCYLLGRSVVGIFKSPPPADPAKVAEILTQTFSFSTLASALFTAEFWREATTLFGKIGLELITGCLICGVTAAIFSYFIIKKMIVEHRIKARLKIALVQ
ncbi:MAG: DUF2062 domain-containing protein [Phycisphaerae bacterium]|nr:DUF2062 domain-containing protein [Phycisphaerae bacterium]